MLQAPSKLWKSLSYLQTDFPSANIFLNLIYNHFFYFLHLDSFSSLILDKSGFHLVPDSSLSAC